MKYNLNHCFSQDLTTCSTSHFSAFNISKTMSHLKGAFRSIALSLSSLEETQYRIEVIIICIPFVTAAGNCPGFGTQALSGDAHSLYCSTAVADGL